MCDTKGNLTTECFAEPESKMQVLHARICAPIHILQT
jgi:hypothetical protein